MAARKKAAAEPAEEDPNRIVKVTMTQDMFGLILGSPPPKRGGVLELPAKEAAVLVRNGQALDGEVDLEQLAEKTRKRTEAAARGETAD